MSLLDDVKMVLDEQLALGGRGLAFKAETPLFGTLPELDSVAVVGLVGAIEERFGIALEDADIAMDSFETVGALVALVERKKAATPH